MFLRDMLRMYLEAHKIPCNTHDFALLAYKEELLLFFPVSDPLH